MPTIYRFARLGACALGFGLAACPRDKNQQTLTAVEARQSLEESTLESQGQALTTETIEISTNFTIGQAVDNAADELREFITTELPCASITLENATLTVDYGASGDTCLYHGKLITGRSEVSVSKNDADEVSVEHTWTDLSNGVVEVNGEATVTYDLADPSRHVVHDLAITRLSDGWTLQSEGDRTQRPLEGGIAEGFQVEGTRAWSSPRGDSSLSIESVEMRWVDPVPQAGKYVLVTPKNKELTLGFERKDDDTITVTLTGPGREFLFDVTQSGAVSEVEE